VEIIEHSFFFPFFSNLDILKENRKRVRTMGRTLYQKILDDHVVRENGDETILLYIG